MIVVGVGVVIVVKVGGGGGGVDFYENLDIIINCISKILLYVIYVIIFCNLYIKPSNMFIYINYINFN